MRNTTIRITYVALNPEDKNVLFSVEDESGYPLLKDYTIEEMQSLDDDRLYGIQACLVSMKGLFDEVVSRRDKARLKVAKEMEQILGEEVKVQFFKIPDEAASRQVIKYNPEEE